MGMGHQNEHCGWSISWVMYVLAIISLIVAIIIAIVAGVKNGEDSRDDPNVRQNWYRAFGFFLLAISLFLGAIYTGGQENQGRSGLLWG